jgi:hypothetical protein
MKMDLDEKQLKAVVREAVKEVLAELRLMPVAAPSAPVTEILIRSGSSEAVRVLGEEVISYCVSQLCLGDIPFDDKISKLLRKIADKIGETPEEVIRKLDNEIKARQFAEDIEKYAKKLGVK